MVGDTANVARPTSEHVSRALLEHLSECCVEIDMDFVRIETWICALIGSGVKAEDGRLIV